ncbi:MAG: DNA cytosine methyltransferase [Prevotellaceae bacterium]|jgi:DNA (cytosine-5)-methyltransferase 1|nr:DNA cytosine methyltransferase [Prevotellaceae bacterium]
MKEKKNIKLLYIDLFCGAGGTSTGVESARHKDEKCAKVIACVNHDANAIASHAANHPGTLHFIEDIRVLELSSLVAHLEKMKAAYPEALVVLWSSLECTNFSKAKGGQPRDADSRTLALHLFRYIEAINPDYIQLENVVEFTTHSWTKPEKAVKDSSDYLQWVERVKGYGYTYGCRTLNAADYGAYTSRKRFFGLFAKRGLPAAWPAPTHTGKPASSLFGKLERWKPVREVLDLSDTGESIFTRKKPLCDKTLWRIYAGLVKFVASSPAPALTVKDRLSLISPSFMVSEYSGGGQHSSLDSACPAILTTPKQKVVSCQYLMNPQFYSAGGSIDAPCFTLIARMDKMPPYIITTEIGQIAVEVYEADSEPMQKIKAFMAQHGIIDIKMRMLWIHELMLIMGFPKGYVLIGSKERKKKFIGNAVEVNMARALCEALAGAVIAKKLAAINNWITLKYDNGNFTRPKYR